MLHNAVSCALPALPQPTGRRLMTLLRSTGLRFHASSACIVRVFGFHAYSACIVRYFGFHAYSACIVRWILFIFRWQRCFVLYTCNTTLTHRRWTSKLMWHWSTETLMRRQSLFAWWDVNYGDVDILPVALECCWLGTNWCNIEVLRRRWDVKVDLIDETPIMETSKFFLWLFNVVG